VDVKLHNVGELIARCWTEAEEETSRAVNEKYWSPGKEDITFIFAGELRSKVKRVSDRGAVEDAFIRDLEDSIPFHRLDADLVRLSRGLIARVNFHNRAHEGRKSAADLGIAIRRPLVRFESYGMQVETHPDHATGLLAQAKLGLRQQKVPARKWGKLTDQQVALFAKRRAYSSLLLYRLGGKEANELRHFRWQLCKDYTVRQVKKWLLSDSFPEEVDSSNVMQRLIAGSIGTEDKKIIQTIIDPSGTAPQAIEVQVYWRPGEGPPPLFALTGEQTQKERLIQTLRY